MDKKGRKEGIGKEGIGKEGIGKEGIWKEGIGKEGRIGTEEPRKRGRRRC
jgi:hypothetical protein